MDEKFNFNQVFKNGKIFLKNPLTYLIGFPVTLIFLLFSDVVALAKQKPEYAISIFIVVFILLGCCSYLYTCYNRINDVIVEFNNAKSKKLEIDNVSIENPMGFVEVKKVGKKMILRGKIKFLSEKINYNYTVK